MNEKKTATFIEKAIEEIDEEIKSREEYGKQEKVYTIIVLILIFELVVCLFLFSFGFI